MSTLIPVEIITEKIFEIRKQKVMIDADLAKLYGVQTKRLNEAVKRNKKRFPNDFIFKLTKDERNELVANCDRFNKLKHSTVMPNAFTEGGVAMLSSILNSDTAIQINVQIVRAFIHIKQLLLTETSIRLTVQALEHRMDKNEENTQLIMNTIQQMLNPPEPEKKKTKMGFGLNTKQ